MKLIFLTYFASAFLSFSAAAATAQNQSFAPVDVNFCTSLLAKTNDRDFEDDPEEDDYIETRLYDQEEARVITDRLEIMDLAFEEKWVFDTKEPIPRYELCPNEPSYVVLWAEIIAPDETGDFLIDAEGYLSIRKDGTFGYIFTNRPYEGTWELDGTDMVFTASWLNNGQPYKTPVEIVSTPVETRYRDGRVDRNVVESYRMGAFRFFRLATTLPAAERDCACVSN
ncbi:hypothetical protein [Aestuariivita boseongensis]|uniref:hypothetical protein n=1 Tax=Aestuariivita boseongensis TaxID=1470562 RepID=UPI000680315E|nr:hypothetical protein [Aestuariivita boseongensis]